MAAENWNVSSFHTGHYYRANDKKWYVCKKIDESGVYFEAASIAEAERCERRYLASLLCRIAGLPPELVEAAEAKVASQKETL